MRKSIVSLVSALVAVMICLPGGASAQAAKGDMAIGAGLELALPMGDFGDVAGTGFGATGQFEYVYNPNISIVGHLGYIKWGGKDFGFYKWSYSVIPIKGGAKYYFDPIKRGFYGSGEIGLHLFSYSSESDIGGVPDYSESSTEFGLALIGGYEMPAGQTFILDLSVRYELISDLNFIGFRVGVKKAIGGK